MKKIAGILAAMMLLGSFATTVSAEKLGVVVGENIDFAEGAEPIIVDNRLMLPLRAVAEALDATVYWFGDEKRIQIVLYDSLLSLQIDNNIMACYDIVDGNPVPTETIEMDVPASIQNDRTYVPIRAISEAFKADVTWDNTNRRAVVVPVKKEINQINVADIMKQPTETLFATVGVIGLDNENGGYYIRSLQRNDMGDYDKVSICTPKSTSISDDTQYSEYIKSYWLEQFETENPSGTVVYLSGKTIEYQNSDGTASEKYFLVNKTTTAIRSLGDYDSYMKSLGVSYEPFTSGSIVE